MRQDGAAVVLRRGLRTTTAAGLLAASFALSATPAPNHGDASRQMTMTAFVAHRSLRQEIASYLQHRDGAVTAAVYDDVAKRLIVVHPKERCWTASVVKADILETLLHRTDGHLSDDQRREAKEMIEHSNNDAATTLWNDDDGARGVDKYDNDVGLKQTKANAGHWGLTTTSAADQVTLVRALLRHSHLLTDAGRGYQRHLMRHVEADQQWGISSGVASNAGYGIKDGWLPVIQDHHLWAVNSVGWVRGDGRRYEIAVLTKHNATESYGIHTIQRIARMAWRNVAVAYPGRL